LSKFIRVLKLLLGRGKMAKATFSATD